MRTTATDYQVTFTGLRAVASNLSGVIQRTIDRVVQQSGSDSSSSSPPPESNSRVRLVLSSDTLDQPISIPFSTVDSMSAERVMNEIQRVLNSNQTFEISDGIKINILTVSLPSMGAYGVHGLACQAGGIKKRYNIDFNDWKRAKRSIITIRVEENRCLLAALAVGSFISSPPGTGAGSTQHGRSNMNKMTTQRNLVVQLCRDLLVEHSELSETGARPILTPRLVHMLSVIVQQVDLSPPTAGRPLKRSSAIMDTPRLPMLTLHDISVMVASRLFTNFEISLYDACFFGTHLVKYSNNSLPTMRINLLYDETSKHVDVVTSLKGLFDAKFYCTLCEKATATKKHLCEKSSCFMCSQPECANTPDIILRAPAGQHCFGEDYESIRECPQCGCKNFKSTKCLEAHLKAGLCKEYKSCEACGARGVCKIPKHICFQTKCRFCNLYFKSDDEHECFVQVPKVKKRSKGAYFAFDIETDQTSRVATTTGDGDTASTFHCPILLVLDSVDDTEIPADTCQTLQVSYEQVGTCRIFRGYDCVDKFCRHIFLDHERKNKPETFFAHFGSGFDFLPILHWLHGNDSKIVPQVIFQSSRILSLSAGTKTFRDSFLFIPLPLSAFSNTFGIEEYKKGHFPHLMSTPENQTFVGDPGEFPSHKLFGAERMSVTKYNTFLEWHTGMCQEYAQKGLRYDYAKELVEYCVSDVKLLKLGVARFQQQISQITNGCIPDVYFIGITAASACNYIYRMMYMPTDSIAILPMSNTTGQASYLKRDMQSIAALSWLEFQHQEVCRQFPNGIFYQSGSRLGEKWIGRYKVDGYYQLDEGAPGGAGAFATAPGEGALDGGAGAFATAPGEGALDAAAGAVAEMLVAIVYEFFGCFYHGCPKCFPDPMLQNPKTGCSMGQLHAQTLARLAWLQAQSGVRVVYIWECQFEALMKQQVSLSHLYHARKQYEPLNPRDAFFGGRTENFKTFWTASPEFLELRYVDICSLYPFVNATCGYPWGHPDSVMTRREIVQSATEGQSLTNVANHVFGIIKCRVIAPRDLWLPVLPCKVDGKLVFTLCHACSQQLDHHGGRPLEDAQCVHAETDRSFWGTFCSPELQLAIEKGYMILDISEVWHWNEEHRSTALFKSYIQAFLKSKTEASDWPDHCKGDSSAQNEYIEAFYKKEGVRLDPGKVAKNEGLRFISKLLLNSFWGYLGMRDNLPKTSYVNSYAGILKAFTSPETEVVDMYLVNPEVAVLQQKKKRQFPDFPTKPNVILAGFTTAHARTILYRYMSTLDNMDKRLCYCDTDSVMYLHAPGLNSIPTGSYLGDMTDELPSSVVINQFYCAGPKFYLLEGKNQLTGETFHTFKIKGITLNQSTHSAVTPQSIKQLVRGELDKLSAPFTYIARDRRSAKLITKHCRKQSRITCNKRIFDLERGSSIPFGYHVSL